MPRYAFVLVAGLSVALAVAACSGGSDSTAPTGASAEGTVTMSPSPSKSASAQTWTMPDLRGRNLQEAQNTIQALTDNEVFFTGSTDLTGQGRQQLIDRNWQVCSSTPPPGEQFTTATSIDFGVVKLDSETCP